MSDANVIDWAIRANDSGFSSVMRGVVDTLTGVKRGTDAVKTGMNDLGASASTAAGQWARHRRELEALYTSMGKLPSKEVVAELDKIEAKYKSLASAAEGGNTAAAGAMRNLLTQARATVTKDTMADTESKPTARESLTDKTVGAATGSLKAAIAGLGAAFTAAAIATHLREQIDLADKLDESAQKAAISAQSLSTLVYAAKFGSVDMDALTGALGKLSKVMFEADTGSKKAAATFTALGVSFKDQEGKLRASDAVLIDLAERFSSMPDNAQKSALAMELFGKSGAEMLPFLNMGAEGIGKLREEARKMGLEISDEAAAAAGDLNDKLDKMHAKTEGVWRQFSMKMIPTLSAAVDGFGESAASGGVLNAAMSAVDVTIKGLIITGAAVAATFKDIGTIIGGVAAAVVSAASGDFQGTRNILGMIGDDIQKNGKAFEDYAKKVWNGQTEKSDGPKATKPVDVSAIRDANAPAAKSKVSEWDNELDRMKLAHQKMTSEEGTFIEFSRERERDFWKAKLDMTSMSSDERYAVEKKYLASVQSINSEAFNAQIAAQKNQMAEMEKNYVAQLTVAKDIAARMQQAYGVDSKQYADAQRAVITVQRQANDQRRQLADLSLAEQRSTSTQSIELERQQNELSLSLGLINRRQYLAMEMDYQSQLQEIRRQALLRKQETTDPDKDPVAHQQILNQLLEQERTFELAKQKLTADLRVESAAPGSGVFSTLESSFSSAADGMLNRAQSWRSSMAGIFISVGTAFVQEMAVKPLAAYVASMAKRLFLTSSTATTETGIETAAAGAKMAASSSASTVAVANNAVVAGSGAAASQASIPYVGPALAAVAMAAMLATVMGMSSSIKSARGGYDIPAGINPMTQLHEEEMVLPARYANVIRGLASAGDPQPAGQGFVYAPQITAMDGKSVRRVLNEHSQVLVDIMKSQQRQMSRG